MPDKISEKEATQRILAAMQAYSKKHVYHECLANDSNCKEVIRAHSVQSSRVLDAIARNGHVYMFTSYNEQHTRLKRIGKNCATTFTGFCNVHDTKLFKSVDFGDHCHFDPNNTQQVVLLSLRATAKEYWTKLNICKCVQLWMNKAKENDIASLQDEYHTGLFIKNSHSHSLCSFYEGTQSSKRRLERMYKSLLTQYRRAKYSLSQTKVYQFPSISNIVAASVFSPEFDYKGNRIESFLPHRDVADIALNVFPLEGITWVVFLFHKRFANQLAPIFAQLDSFSTQDRAVALSKMIIVNCENVAFSPEFIESLKEDEKLRIESIFDDTVVMPSSYDFIPDLNFF